MKTRAAVLVALLAGVALSCTVTRFPDDCLTAPQTTVRVKNKAFGWTPDATAPLGRSC